MSFIPPVPTQFDAEQAKAREHELAQRAAQYARQHPDGDVRAASAGPVRRAFGRLRKAFARGA